MRFTTADSVIVIKVSDSFPRVQTHYRRNAQKPMLPPLSVMPSDFREICFSGFELATQFTVANPFAASEISVSQFLGLSKHNHLRIS